jgi:adenine deaminase
MAEVADLLIKNGLLADPWRGTIEKSDISILDGRIYSFSVMEAREVVDAEGSYVSCGLIESHLHVEGLHLLPQHHAAAFLARGTTTIVTDLHEIANAGGLGAIEWYLSLMENIPLDLFVMAPSCVPSSKHESGGGTIGIEELRRLKALDNVIGLGEVMDIEGVLGREPEVMAKIELFRGMPIDGHAPGLVGRTFDRYCSAGIHSDHETSSADEGEEKLRKGMHLFLREGSAAKDLTALGCLVRPGNLNRLSLCTDDLSARDLFETGHLDQLIGRLVRSGVPLLDALKLATVNPALYFNLSDRNALALGRRADIIIFDMEEDLRVRTTVKDGKVVFPRKKKEQEQEIQARNPVSHMKVRGISPDDLRKQAKGAKIRVIGVSDGSIVTVDLVRPIRTKEGYLVSDPDNDVIFAYVFDRYRAEETFGFGFVHGFEIKRGAIGSTYAHDSHNLMVVGDNIEDIYTVIQTLKDCRGGMAASHDGVCLVVPMPYFGIISHLDSQAYLKKESEMGSLVRRMGIRLKNPFFQMSFLSLPVIPQLRLTTKGLFHVPTSTFVPANHD